MVTVDAVVEQEGVPSTIGGDQTEISSLHSSLHPDELTKANSRRSTGTTILEQLEFEGDSSSEGPWWIPFMKKEGLLDDDTSTVFPEGGIDAMEDSAPTTTTTTPQNPNAAQPPAIEKGQENKSGHDGQEEEEKEEEEEKQTENDWKERLWFIARNHWTLDVDDTLVEVKSVAEATEAALLSSHVDQDNDDDHEQIQHFQHLLVECAQAYIQVFGDHQHDKNDNDDDGAPPDTTKKERKATKSLATEATRMSPYVPLAIVRALFQHVVWQLEIEKEAAAKEKKKKTKEAVDKPTYHSKEDVQFLHFVEHVTRVLLSPELRLFETYVVEPMASKNGSSDAMGTLMRHEGRRVRTDRIHDTRHKQRDMEQLLYGDLPPSTTEEKKQETEPHEEEDFQEGGPEEEVQIRKEAAKIVLQMTPKSDLEKKDWRLLFVEEILMKSMLKDSRSQDHLAVSHFLTARVDRRSETSLAYMYAVRYFPHYFLRASWSQPQQPVPATFFNPLMQYFGDTRLIRNRLVVLGIYNGVQVHVEELNSLLEDICSPHEEQGPWQVFFRNVHASVARCLGSVLEENMRVAAFLPSKTVDGGVDWKATTIADNPSFHAEHDHPKIVSVCLEVGRSLHFQGVSLGKREQKRVSSMAGRDFDGAITKLEVSAYLEAQSSYRGALKVLRRAEGDIKASIQSRVNPDNIDINNNNNKRTQQHKGVMVVAPKPDDNREQMQAMRHINEARITIDLYLADTSTTLAYCYEAKVFDLGAALKQYTDSVALYTRHVGKEHLTVTHALLSIGCIHIELQQWGEAIRSLNECLESVTVMNNKMEMALTLKNLSRAKLEIGDFDGAVENLSKSIEETTAVLAKKDAVVRVVRGEPGGPPCDPFICDALSMIVDVLLAKLTSLKNIYAKRRLALLYTDRTDIDVDALDAIRLSRLQVERRAIEVSRDAVRMREQLLYGAESLDRAENLNQLSFDPIKFEMALSFVVDLMKQGKLLFRRCDYSDAIACWNRAIAILETNPTDDEKPMTASRVGLGSGSLAARKLSTLAELAYLKGIASCRLGGNEIAVASFDSAISCLEDKRKLLREDRTNGMVRVAPTDLDWDILDMDVAYCEHALGLAYFYCNQFAQATSHYREALRVFEAVAARRKSRKTPLRTGIDHETRDVEGTRKQSLGTTQTDQDLDIAINNAIASVMLSLGALYHEQEKAERAKRFLEGAIQIVHSTTNRILTMPRGTSLKTYSSTTGCNEMSLVVSIIRVGDAHRRLGELSMERRNEEDGRLSYETAMRYLESTNLEARLTLNVDDEKHLETIGQAEVHEMLTSCYEQMLQLAEEEHAEDSLQKFKWWGFGRRDTVEDEPKKRGLTREDILFRLGNVHAKRRQYDASIRCFLEARELTEEKLGTCDHPIVGNILFNLGSVYKSIYAAQSRKADQKARERAIECFVESLQITRATTGTESLAVAEVMEALASVLSSEDDSGPMKPSAQLEDGGATSFLRDAVSIRSASRSEMSLAYGQSMHLLGVLSLGRYLVVATSDARLSQKALDEAVSSLSHALRVRRLLLGDHLEVANTAHRLGVALWKKSTFSVGGGGPVGINAALKQLNEAVFIRSLFLERASSEESTPDDFTFDRAQNEFRAELDGTTDVSSVVVNAVENLYDIALVHQSQENFEACRKYLKDALDLLRVWIDRFSASDIGPGSRFSLAERNAWHAKIFHHKGVCWLATKDYDKATEDFEDSLKFRGLDATETATHDEVFDNFFRQQQPAQEEHSPDTLASAVTMERLGKCYEEREMLEEALRCFSFCLRVFGAFEGEQSAKVAVVLRRMGKLYQDRHDYKRCVRALQRTLHIRDATDTEYIPRIDDALVYLQLARALMALGAYDDVALEHYHSAVGILEDCNHLKKSQASTGAIASLIERDATDLQKTDELLLEGYSSILVLMRRKGSDEAEDEKNVTEVLHHIGNTQASLRQYDKALKSLTHVLQFQRRSKGNEDLSVSDILFNLGNIYVETGQVEKARACHHECHVIASKILGADSMDLAENMICLGNIEFLDTNYPLALEWFDEALRLLRRNAQYEVAIAKCLHRKAVAHDKLGEYDKSVECFGEVLRLGRKIWGGSHMELSNVLNSVGNVHRNRGEVKRALRCYEESLRIRTKVHDELGVANTKNNIGAIFTAMGRNDRARRFYAEALRVKTAKLGASDVETARTLYNMGQLYIVDKQYEKGLRFFCEALKIFKLQFGETHNEVGSCLCSIGTIYDEMGNEEQALSFFRMTLNAVKGQHGAAGVRASALHNVGIILTKRGDLDHSVRVFREALSLKSGDRDSDDLSDTQYCLANVLRLTGCSNEAAELHRVALDTRLRYLGPEHLDVANSMFGLSQSLVDISDHREASALLEECIRIREVALNGDHDLVADASFLLGIVKREVGNLTEALSLMRKALSTKTQSCGPETVEVADISFKIAIVLCEMGRYEEAKTHNERCRQIRASLDGTSSLEVSTILENMAVIEQKLGNHEEAIEKMKEVLRMRQHASIEGGSDVSRIVHSMASSYSELKQYDDALRLFDDAVKRIKRLHGPKHIDVARTLVDQGYVFEELEQFERALMCYEEAVDCDCFEDCTWEMGRVFMRMGLSHFALAKSEDSWDCLSEATRVFEVVERRERSSQTRSKRDLHDLIKCYECMLRLSEGSPARYNVDRSLVLPKVASVLAQIKDFERASVLYKDAVELQRALPGDTRFVVAMNLHNLGNCQYQLGEYAEALTCLEDALGLLQDIVGVEGKHIADTYHSLAVVHQARTDFQEALTCYNNAMKSRKGDDALNSDGVVSTLANMGEVLRSLGMYDASIKSCKDALRLVHTKDDESLLLVARIVECIGLTHTYRQEPEKAARCFKESLKQRRDVAGHVDPVVGKTLHDLGIVLLRKGDTKKADECFSESVEVILSVIGVAAGVTKDDLGSQLRGFVLENDRKNPLVAVEALTIFGSLMYQRGRSNDALLCDSILLEFIKSKYGSDHLTVGLVNHRMGVELFDRGDFTAATGVLRDALHVRRSKLGSDHVETQETLLSLARTYASSGDSEMALYCFKEVMKSRRAKRTKVDHDSEADLLLRLGKLHLEQREFSEALSCVKDSLRLQRQGSKNRNEHRLGETLQCMGSALLFIKQFQEARLTLLSALKILERADESEREWIATSFLLGRVNEEEASYEKALAWYDRSKSIMKRSGSADRKMEARIMLRVGMVKFAMDDWTEGLRLVSEAREMLLAVLGPDHEELAECVHSCGLVHLKTANAAEARDCFRSALKIRRNRLHHDDPALGDSLHGLGVSLLELQRLEDANICLQEALRLRLHNYGDSHPAVGETHRFLGQVELGLGQHRLSMDHFQEAIRVGMAELNTRSISDGDYKDLNSCFEAAISLSRRGVYPERLGKLFHEQGTLQTAKDRYRDALNSFTEAIQVYKSLHGEEHLNVANALFNVGVCLKETGDIDRAMKCFSRALSITSSQLGEDHEQVAETLQQMAEVYNLKNDTRGAIKWCEKALQVRRYKEDHALATLLNFAGELYSRCNDSAEAERSFRECVRIRRKLYGEDHLDVAQPLYSLGFVFETTKQDFKRALRSYEESLRIRKNVMEEPDLETARCYLHLGSVHAALADEKKAAFCFNVSISLCAQLGEPENEIVEDAIVGQGHSLLAQGKSEAALAQYERARLLRRERCVEGERDESKEAADLRLFEANALQELGNSHEALSRLVMALDMYKLSVGMEHLATASALQRIAEVKLEMGDEDEALASAQQALKIRKNRLGKHEEATGESYFVIGKILSARNEYDTAKPCLVAAYEIFRHKRPADHISVADCMFLLGCIFESGRDWDEAIRCFSGALLGRQKNCGDGNLAVAEVLFKLGCTHKRRDEYETSADYFSECLRIRTAAYGPDHVSIADTLYELAGSMTESEKVSGKIDPPQCYVDAIRIYRQSLGESHVSVAKCLARLGDIMESKNDMQKAGSCYEKAVAIFENKLSDNPSPEDISSIELEDDYEAYAAAVLDYAAFLDGIGNDGSAMKTYRRALGLYRVLRGQDDEIIDETLCKIANVLGRQDRFGEALHLLEEVRKRREAAGQDQPFVGDVYFALANLHEKQREYPQAIAALDVCLRIRRATSGAFSEEVGTVLSCIGRMQAHRADFKSAMRSWEEALAIFEKAGVPGDSEEVQAVLGLLANAHQTLATMRGGTLEQ